MEHTTKHYKVYKKLILKVLLVLVPVVLLLLPIDFFDSGQSICLSVLLLKAECYGCGMTRAIMHFIHLDFSGAWNYNMLSFIVAPLLLILYTKLFFRHILNKEILQKL